MITLQLKRTDLSLTDNKIKNLILAKGEPFLILEDSYINDETDDRFKRKLLFIGDGTSTLSSLFERGLYIVISKYVIAEQILSIPDSALPEGLATLDDLQNLEESFNESLTSGFNTLDKSIDLFKTYNAVCNTEASVANKVVEIDIPVYRDPNTNIINPDTYLGLTLVVNFKYGNTAEENVTLVVKDLNNNTIVSGEMYIGNSKITAMNSSAFSWRNGDTLIFTYLKKDGVGVMSMAGTTAQSLLSTWCATNNATLINGGMIATGSIAADRIQGHSITADQIAVGSLPASALQPSFSDALNNLSTIEKQAASSKQIVAVCSTAAGQNPKKVFLEGSDALAVSIRDGMPIPGTTLVVKFLYPNVLGTAGSTTTSLQLMLDTIPFPAGDGKGYSVVTYSGNDSKDVKEDSFLNWTGVYNEDKLKDTSGNNIRTLIFNGSEWEVQPTNGDLLRAANWCLEHNQTYIQGGNIVTGRIYADQINAGSLNVGDINLYSTDNIGNTMAILKSYYGSNGSSTTYGMMMAGSDEEHFRVIATNGGTMLTGGNGGQVFCWEGTTTDSNGNIVNSAGGRAGIHHNNIVELGNSDRSTNSVRIRAENIYLDCTKLQIRNGPGSSYQTIWP